MVCRGPRGSSLTAQVLTAPVCRTRIHTHRSSRTWGRAIRTRASTISTTGTRTRIRVVTQTSRRRRIPLASATPNPHQGYGVAGSPVSDKSKIAAALLAFFLGTLGVHNFYLGHNSRGAIQLALTVFGWITAIFLVGFFLIIGVSIWAFIEFILILVGSGSYAYDANGRRLQS